MYYEIGEKVYDLDSRLAVADLLPCFSVIVLLLAIRVGCVIPTSFQLPPLVSSSDDKIVSSSSPAPTPAAGGGVMSSINQS